MLEPGTREPPCCTGEDAAPSERGFETLLEACLRFDVTAALVFTCRDGVARTSTGMAVGCVVWRVRSGELPEFLSKPDPARPNYEQAEFKPVIRIVNALGQLGLQAKQVLDDAIDKCNVLVDLRRMMNRCRMVGCRRGRGAGEGGQDHTVGNPFFANVFLLFVVTLPTN